MNVVVIVTEQITTPPPPFAEPLHCCTVVTTSVDVEVAVVHVPAPALIGPAAPTHRVTVTVDGLDVSIVPVPVTKLVIETVHAIP